jgi:hypothetical protein
MEQRLLKPEMRKSNPFEKTFNTASAGDRGNGGFMTKKGFHTNDVSALKSFSGVHDYKTKSFAQSDQASRFGKQNSQFDKKDSRYGSQTFATKDSRYGKQAAQQDSKMFSGNDKTFKTGDFGPGMQSIKDNKRPVIEVGERDPSKNANAYSEAEVKRLMGR